VQKGKFTKKSNIYVSSAPRENGKKKYAAKALDTGKQNSGEKRGSVAGQS